MLLKFIIFWVSSSLEQTLQRSRQFFFMIPNQFSIRFSQNKLQNKGSKQGSDHGNWLLYRQSVQGNASFLFLEGSFAPQKEPSKELELIGTRHQSQTYLCQERAHRHYIPGCVWHITHRCHKQDFLLSFEKDRRRWCHWFFESKKRYGLCVLNYIVTSNHITC